MVGGGGWGRMTIGDGGRPLSVVASDLTRAVSPLARRGSRASRFWTTRKERARWRTGRGPRAWPSVRPQGWSSFGLCWVYVMPFSAILTISSSNDVRQCHVDGGGALAEHPVGRHVESSVWRRGVEGGGGKGGVGISRPCWH